MVSRATLWVIAAGGLALAASSQNPSSTTLPSSSPPELVTGQIQTVSRPAGQAAALRRLGRARSSYALRSAGRAYRLKVSFTVNSGGQTQYDGAWQMEDVFDPKQGLRWTASASAAYAITRISSNGMLYGEETGSYIPLRLHEARAALFDPMPSADNVAHASLRTSTGNFNGAQLACVLLGESGSSPAAAAGRRWDETEECFDPQSGLLVLHSQVPGRYYAYEYSNALQLAGHILPGKIHVVEAGRTVTEISVDSLTELPAADPSLFAPTEAMKTRGRPVAMGAAQKLFRSSGQASGAQGAASRTVCVFGLVTASGELVEAHPLQPSDPNSPAALAAAHEMSFLRPAPGGANPQQHFVFVIERFASSR